MSKTPAKKVPAKKRAPAKRAPKAPVGEKVIASIKVMGKKYEGKGATVLEALSALDVRGGRGMAVLTVSRGSKRVEKVLHPRLVAGLLSPSPTMRTIRTKSVSLLFDV